jgi:hypothetical protein
VAERGTKGGGGRRREGGAECGGVWVDDDVVMIIVPLASMRLVLLGCAVVCVEKAGTRKTSGLIGGAAPGLAPSERIFPEL